MTYLNIFLFFIGLAPISGDMNNVDSTNSKPVYQSIEAVGESSTDVDHSEVTKCWDFPECIDE